MELKSREEYTDELVNSDHRKKLVVAGPGTGKTTVFKKILERQRENGLVLTFINALVDDLETKLMGLAEVYTLHKFSKMQLYKHETKGATKGFHHYPPLPQILSADVSETPGLSISRKELAKALRNLDESSALESALRFAERYNAVGHDEIVYRVTQLFDDDHNRIPQYSVVIIDEFQDFNCLEAKLIAQLAKKNAILIAGDDDQAVYEFKHASTRFIRSLASNPHYKRFELPYCSRCPEVIVNATNDFTKLAEGQGALKNRVEKLFLPHESKAELSKTFPKIIHAYCSTHGKTAGYMTAQYIASQLRKLDVSHANASVEEDCLTALIIGPKNFVGDVYRELHDEFPWLQQRASVDQSIQSFDGYRMLATEDRSELGWRIVAHCNLPSQAARLASQAAMANKRMADVLQSDFCELHAGHAGLVARLMKGEGLTPSEILLLEGATGMEYVQIIAALGIELGDEPDDEYEGGLENLTEEQDGETTCDDPGLSGLCTTILSSKGLAALYVFVVGVVEGQFPDDSSKLKEKEACEFIVALTRTKWQCHLVTCKYYQGQDLGPAKFLKSLSKHIHEVWISKTTLSNFTE